MVSQGSAVQLGLNGEGVMLFACGGPAEQGAGFSWLGVRPCFPFILKDHCSEAGQALPSPACITWENLYFSLNQSLHL